MTLNAAQKPLTALMNQVLLDPTVIWVVAAGFIVTVPFPLRRGRRGFYIGAKIGGLIGAVIFGSIGALGVLNGLVAGTLVALGPLASLLLLVILFGCALAWLIRAAGAWGVAVAARKLAKAPPAALTDDEG